MAVQSPQERANFGWWVTGFVDGEGCFYAGLSFRPKKTLKGSTVDCVELDARLSITLRADDVDVLVKIRDYFGCGVIKKKQVTKNAPSKIKQGQVDPKPQHTLEFRRPDDLLNVILPHFENFPLQAKKQKDFEVWRDIVLFAHEHLIGKKGWLRRYNDKVQELNTKCAKLKATRTYTDPTFPS